MRLSLMVVTILVLALVVIPASAQISTTKHDLTSAGGSTLKGTGSDLCVYCHTPHSQASTTLLWNRISTLNTTTFTPYTATDGDQFGAAPNAPSMLCLSCHDGTTALNSLHSPGDANAGGKIGDGVTGAANIGGATNNDLSNDHPVSVPLPAAGGGFKAMATVLPLHGGAQGTGTVECKTCHDPHSNQAKFLRMSNAASALCLNCHQK